MRRGWRAVDKQRSFLWGREGAEQKRQEKNEFERESISEWQHLQEIYFFHWNIIFGIHFQTVIL